MEVFRVLFKYDLSRIKFFSSKPKQEIMKYLNVAEKNDAAKNIAAILSRGASTRVSTVKTVIISVNELYCIIERRFLSL